MSTILVVLIAAGDLIQAKSIESDIGPLLANPSSYDKCLISERLDVKGKVELKPNCVFSTIVTLSSSNSELDCKGSVIDPGLLQGYAVHINSHGEPLSNITIRNCIVRNSNAIALVIGWKGSDQDKVDHYTRDEIYRRTPHQIQIINSRIENSKGAGIYVDDYVSDVAIRRVSILRSDAMAIYLEHSSRGITIEDSLFENNSTIKKREAIAIDSSANNIVRRNIFRHNKAGGIFLYKNCQEHANTDAKQTRRWQGADSNLIENNVFEDEPIGVWIASRQSLDLRKLDCGDPYYGEKYVLDHAQDNTIRGNIFRNVDRGVIVEDDHNVIANNLFEGIGELCVEVGAKARTILLNRPVTDVSVMNNRCNLIGNSHLPNDSDANPIHRISPSDNVQS
jgi:hypothetical protein